MTGTDNDSPSIKHTREPLLSITDEEWATAQRYLYTPENQKKGIVKYKRIGENGQLHSFIKVGNEVFAMASKLVAGPEKEKYSELGKGNFGKVKVVQSRRGDNFAVKIEARTAEKANDPLEENEKAIELEIMNMLGEAKGQTKRKLGFMSEEFLPEFSPDKLYTVIKLHEGENLYKRIYCSIPEKDLSDIEKLEIGLKICLGVSALHDKGILHGDIKPDNFMINSIDEMIVLHPIDFGKSKLLSENQTFVIDQKAVGMPEYTAPEVSSTGKYSFASDIYALGQMLEVDLDLDSSLDIHLIALIGQMEFKKPETRPPMDRVIEVLRAAVENKALNLNNPTEEINKVYANLDKYLNDLQNTTTLDKNNQRRVNWILKQIKKPTVLSEELLSTWLDGSKLPAIKHCKQTLLNVLAFSEKHQAVLTDMVSEHTETLKPLRPR